LYSLSKTTLNVTAVIVVTLAMPPGKFHSLDFAAKIEKKRDEEVPKYLIDEVAWLAKKVPKCLSTITSFCEGISKMKANNYQLLQITVQSQKLAANS